MHPHSLEPYRQLAALLDSILGEFVETYDRDSLKIAVWKGEVILISARTPP